MPDEIFGKDSEPKKEDTPKDDASKQILDTISSLKESIDSVNTRLDEFDTKISDLSTPSSENKEEGWKPKTWDEIPQKAEEIATTIVDQKLSERDEQAKEAQKAEEEKQKKMDAFIDNQMADLEKNGVLPKVEDAANDDDPGRNARRELLGFAGRIGTLDLGKANEVLKVLHESGRTYDPRANNMQGDFLRSNTTPSGINAPVASSNRPISSTGKQVDYKTLHNASMDTLIKSVMPDYS